MYLSSATWNAEIFEPDRWLTSGSYMVLGGKIRLLGCILKHTPREPSQKHCLFTQGQLDRHKCMDNGAGRKDLCLLGPGVLFAYCMEQTGPVLKRNRAADA